MSNNNIDEEAQYAGKRVEELRVELIKRYNMDTEGQAMLMEFAANCGIVSANIAADSIIGGLSQLAADGRIDKAKLWSEVMGRNMAPKEENSE